MNIMLNNINNKQFVNKACMSIKVEHSLVKVDDEIGEVDFDIVS